jgi:hypothetical protein
MSQTTRLFLSFSSRIADFRHLPPTGVHTERVLKASRRGRAAGHEPRALSIEVPPMLLARADEVIE